MQKRMQSPQKWWYHAENDAITTQNEKVMRKYWVCAENNGVTAQNNDIMQKMMQSPQKWKSHVQNVSCRKWCIYCTK